MMYQYLNMFESIGYVAVKDFSFQPLISNEIELEPRT